VVNIGKPAKTVSAVKPASQQKKTKPPAESKTSSPVKSEEKTNKKATQKRKPFKMDQDTTDSFTWIVWRVRSLYAKAIEKVNASISEGKRASKPGYLRDIEKAEDFLKKHGA
jgi:hypothetical protein